MAATLSKSICAVIWQRTQVGQLANADLWYSAAAHTQLDLVVIGCPSLIGQTNQGIQIFLVRLLLLLAFVLPPIPSHMATSQQLMGDFVLTMSLQLAHCFGRFGSV